jgi:hypothetical protein
MASNKNKISNQNSWQSGPDENERFQNRDLEPHLTKYKVTPLYILWQGAWTGGGDEEENEF